MSSILYRTHRLTTCPFISSTVVVSDIDALVYSSHVGIKDYWPSSIVWKLYNNILTEYQFCFKVCLRLLIFVFVVEITKKRISKKVWKNFNMFYFLKLSQENNHSDLAGFYLVEHKSSYTLFIWEILYSFVLILLDKHFCWSINIFLSNNTLIVDI